MVERPNIDNLEMPVVFMFDIRASSMALLMLRSLISLKLEGLDPWALPPLSLVRVRVDCLNGIRAPNAAGGASLALDELAASKDSFFRWRFNIACC